MTRTSPPPLYSTPTLPPYSSSAAQWTPVWGLLESTVYSVTMLFHNSVHFTNWFGLVWCDYDSHCTVSKIRGHVVNLWFIMFPMIKLIAVLMMVLPPTLTPALTHCKNTLFRCTLQFTAHCGLLIAYLQRCRVQCA